MGKAWLNPKSDMELKQPVGACMVMLVVVVIS